MLRRVLIVLLVVLSGLQVATTVAATVDGERNRMQNAAAEVGSTFAIPADPTLADPQPVYAALRDASTKAGVNVFRTSIGYDRDDAPVVTQYLLLTEPTEFYTAFVVERGSVLSPQQTLAGRDFLSTADSGDAAQTGLIRHLPWGATVTVRPLEQAFESVPTAGTYYVECAHRSACEAFQANLVNALNSLVDGSGFTPESFAQSSQGVPGIQDNYFAILLGITYLLVVFIVILVVYRQLYEAKRAAVLRLHGASVVAIWFRISGLPIAVTLASAGAVAIGAVLLLPGVSSELVSQLVALLARTAGIVLVASLLTCFYIDGIRIAEAIKNRKDTRLLLVVSTVLKSLFATLLIVTGAGLWGQFTDARAQEAKLGGWNDTANYAIFYPTSVGNDLGDVQTGGPGPTPAEAYDLYEALNSRGALYVDSTAFEPAALAQPLPAGGVRSLVVNPNFLAAYPVLDDTGAAVAVDEKTTDWIVLAPESLRSDSARLTAFFEQQRAAVPEAERAVFHRPVSDAVASQKVRIVWIADGQSVFSFNPVVAPDDANTVPDPVIQVLTTANSAGIDRANAISGGIDAGLKVRIEGAGAAETLHALQPQLHALKLDDNLLHLVTLDDYALVQLQFLRQGIANIAVVAGSLLVVLLVLAVQNLTLVFERFSRRVVVRRIFGHSFVSRYREFVTLFASIAVTQLAGAALLNLAGVTPFATSSTSATAPFATVLGVAAAVVLVEFAVSVAALSIIERRRISSVLKGEF